MIAEGTGLHADWITLGCHAVLLTGLLASCRNRRMNRESRDRKPEPTQPSAIQVETERRRPGGADHERGRISK